MHKATRKWLWRQVTPELYLFPTGLLGACISGLGMPAIGLLMAEFVTVFYNADVAEMRRDARVWGIVFLVRRGIACQSEELIIDVVDIRHGDGRLAGYCGCRKFLANKGGAKVRRYSQTAFSMVLLY